MKRMCVLCVALFVLVMALPALATETRVETMGDQHMFIQDDYNIWTWTSTVNNYPRHLIVDHNSSGVSGDASRVGMIVPFMKNAVVGAFFSNDYFYEGNIGFPNYSWYWPNQKLDLFYGYRATNFDLGLHVDWWGDKSEQGAANQSTSLVGLQAGVGFNANGNMFELQAGYHKLSYAYEPINSFNDSTLNDDGSSYISAGGRYLWAYNNMVTLVPALMFEQWKDKNLAGEEVKFTAFDIGVGCNTVPLQGTEFLTSLGVEMDKYEGKDAGTTVDDERYTAIPYVKFGADIQVKPWLNFRVGAQKYIQATYENKLADIKETHPEFDYNIGAGIMLGDVQFDAEVSRDWLNQGPYFLSGYDGGWMFPKISFKYDYR
jgi:hypothetical protein